MKENNVIQNSPQSQQPVQPVENQNQTSMPAGKSKLPMMLIVIFVSLIIFASGAYYLGLQTKNTNQQKQALLIPTAAQNSPTPSTDLNREPTGTGATANWKTYINEKFGFSLKYPEKFNTRCKADSFNCSFDSFVGPGRGPENFIWLSIIPADPKQRTYENSNVYNGTGMDVLLNTKENESNAIANKGTDIEKYFIYKRLNNTNIDGVSSEVFENQQPWEFPKGTIEKRLYFTHNNYLYVIGAYTESADISLGLFQQILSTFKFTDQNQQAPTSLEINGFPVFPGATFVKKETTAPCTGNESGFTDCGSTTYTWTSDKADKVYDSYTKDQSNSGWKMSGGAGSFIDSQNYNGNIALKKSNLTYGLAWEARDNKVTFTLVITQ